MGTNSRIEWTDHTLNFWQGCRPVSEGCANCYMYRDKRRYGQDPAKVVRSKDATFKAARKWKTPARVFVCSWSDFFIEEADEWRAEAWEEIRKYPHLTWMILTKRPQNILNRLPSDWGNGWPNVFLGVTAENQEQADKRIPILLQIPAAVRFVSVEPMLSNINIVPYIGHNAYKCGCGWHDTENTLFISGYDKCIDGPEVAVCKNCEKRAEIYRALDWVICGGESGPGARPMHPDWVRSLRDQCQAAGVPFLFKQWGEWKGNYPGDTWEPTSNMKFHYFERPNPPGKVWQCGKKKAGRLLDGKEYNEFPQ